MSNLFCDQQPLSLPSVPTSSSSPISSNDILSSSPKAKILSSAPESNLSFFPPYDSPQLLAVTTSPFTMTAPATSWTRPTACIEPNPPRKRIIPIAFASNSFNPKGWSVPTSPTAVGLEGNPFDVGTVEDGLGVPAVLPAPVAARPALPLRKRTTPLAFATNSFDPRGWSIPVSPASTYDSLSASDSEEVLVSPTDSMLLCPPPSFRRQTEPIRTAPFQKAGPTTSVLGEWLSRHSSAEAKAQSIKACTKWMNESLGRPAPPKPLSFIPHVEMLKPSAGHQRTQSSDSTSTVRPSCKTPIGDNRVKRSSDMSTRGEGSVDGIQSTGEITLTEIHVSTLHPHLTRLPRAASPHMGKQVPTYHNTIEPGRELSTARSRAETALLHALDKIDSTSGHHPPASTTEGLHLRPRERCISDDPFFDWSSPFGGGGLAMDDSSQRRANDNQLMNFEQGGSPNDRN